MTREDAVEHADGAGEWVSVGTYLRVVEQRDQLRADVAQLTRERDVLLHSQSALKELLRQSCDKRDEALARVESLCEDVASLNGIVAELSAPPVVPEGWEVASRLGRWGLLDRHGYAVDADELGVMHMSIDDYIPWAALRALAWANEHDARPPHAGDE